MTLILNNKFTKKDLPRLGLYNLGLPEMGNLKRYFTVKLEFQSYKFI